MSCVLQVQATPLHEAARSNKVNCILMLLKEGAQVDAKSEVSYISVTILCVYCIAKYVV